MIVRGYTAKKRMMALKRLWALPLRSSAIRDVIGHVAFVASSSWKRARAHALPLAIGAFLLCTVFDLFSVATRPLRATGVARVPLTASSAAVAPSAAVAAEPAPLAAQPKTATDAPPVEVMGPHLPRAKEAQHSKPVTTKPTAVKKRIRRQQPVGILAEHEVASVLRIAGVPRAHVNAMTCTARFESSFNPRAVNSNANGTRDTGLFQINDVWLEACEVTREDLFDPIVNAKCARRILDKQGLKAWAAWQTRKHVCDGYKVGDFERKGLKTIRSIDEAHAIADHG